MRDTIKVIIKNGKEILASTDQTIHSSLALAGIELEAACGGHGTCGKCKVKVISGQMADSNGNPVEPQEDGYHLACQVYPLEDLVLDRIFSDGVSSKGEIGGKYLGKGELDSPVKKICFKPVYPDILNNYSMQEMINRSELGYPVDILALKQLGLTTLFNPELLTVVIVQDQITAFEIGDTTKTLYGVAFDIGSTTVAGMLLDINEGKVIAAAARTNPQTVFGADVISRIKAAGTSEGLKKLSTIIRECLNSMILDLCSQSGVKNEDIYLITIAGNSTMEHLLLSISPTYLSKSPYVSVFNYIPAFTPEKLNLNINSNGRVVLLPNIASFVGADTVAAITAVDQDTTDKITLLIDLGTNGELTIRNKNNIFVTSTAAGPAFEGGELSCGMRAGEGAIDDVSISDNVYVTTINNAKVKGIAGSGVIKAIAELLKAGIIDPSGRFRTKDEFSELPPQIVDRLQERNREKVFILAFAKESETEDDIYLSQGDIRKIQLVKSSIYTGAEILLEEIGVKFDEVDQVLIAGAFGNYIDLESAVTLGLIPQSDLSLVHPVGNAAGTGAVKALLSQKHLERCWSVAQNARFVELANHPQFQDMFVSNLAFKGSDF